MTLGEYLKQYRDAHDLSQRQFAALCGVSNGYISMLEKGENPKTGEPITPTMQSVVSIARGMGMTMQELLSEVDDLYLDLTENEKQPPGVEGLSDLAMQIARIVDLLPEESRRLLLVEVQALERAAQAPASGEESP